jgi:hypothetical protein
MDIEFIPKIRGGKDRLSTLKKIEFKIEESIKAKRRADLEAMSQEEKIENWYTAILPEIPKTKKGIDKAIDTFINDYTPETDNGEGLLEYLGFYDIGEGIDEGDWTIRAMYLRERIKFKEEGDTITILSSTKEVVNVVREYLQSLPTEELYNLWIFGIVVTEEEANENKERFIDQAKYWYMNKLYCYAEESYNFKPTNTEEDVLLRAGEREYKLSKYHFFDTTEEENLAQYKKLIIKAITEYPEEATAYCRAYKMLRNNYSERAILSTIDKILSNGTTTD